MRLRPSMRENYRYILASIIPYQAYDTRGVYQATAESVVSLYGDEIAARIWPSVMASSKNFVIIRCRRGMEKKLETALAAITHIQGEPAAVHSIRRSGTILSLKEWIQKKEEAQLGKAIISGNMYDIISSQRGRIDLKEKGIYLDIPRYITKEDTEDFYNDE